MFFYLVFIRLNDTSIGDPLYAVPFRPDHTSLCYEVHSEANQNFNLISDSCTNVNAYYGQGNREDYNVITAIGVYAVGTEGCHRIQVNVDCSYQFDGVTVDGNTRVDGIYV